MYKDAFRKPGSPEITSVDFGEKKAGTSNQAQDSLEVLTPQPGEAVVLKR